MLEQLQAQKGLAQAELIKATAAMQKNKMQMIIDGLKHQLDSLKAASEEGKNVAELNLAYDEMLTNAALELTKIEATSQSQQDANLAQNKQTVANK